MATRSSAANAGPGRTSSSVRQACLSRFMSEVCTISNEVRGSNGPPRHMGYNVTLKPSDHRFEVKEGQSVLQAGLDAGFMMPYSCRTGVCRTCRGTVREGSVDYGAVHPTYLPDSDKAKGFALLCQARPLSGLVVVVRELEGMRAEERRVGDESADVCSSDLGRCIRPTCPTATRRKASRCSARRGRSRTSSSRCASSKAWRGSGRGGFPAR